MKNKIFKIILFIFIIIIVISLVLFINSKIMTRKEMTKLVENVQKIDSYYSIMKNSNDVTIETWKKGNKVYVKNDNFEEFLNIENFKVFEVNNANKEIKLNNSLSYDPITDLKTRLKMDLCEYKYINKDIIDEIDVYKFKLIERSPDKKDFIEFTYWVDSLTGLPLKIILTSTYDNDIFIEEFSNYYNIDVIKEFNIDNYVNYQCIDNHIDSIL